MVLDGGRIQDSLIINNDDKLRISIQNKLVECLSFGFSQDLRNIHSADINKEGRSVIRH